MSAVLYDNALLNKIKNWIKDPNVTITGPSESHRLFQYRLDQGNDQPLKLPLIALSRDPDMTILSPFKQPLSYDGFKHKGTLLKDENGEITGKIEQLNAIPIELHYQLDIYTRYYEEAEEYVRNFTFNLINYPSMKITVPYNSYNQEKICSLNIESTVSDNSDVPERLIPGQFTRKTFSIYIKDAYLWDVRVRDTVRMSEEIPVDIQLSSDLDTKIEIQGDMNG